MPDVLISFLNIFMVPVICLQLYRRNFIQVALSNAELFIRYCILAVLNFPIANLFLMLANKLMGKEYSIASTAFTIAACISALLLPFIVGLFQKYFQVRMEVTADEEK